MKQRDIELLRSGIRLQKCDKYGQSPIFFENGISPSIFGVRGSGLAHFNPQTILFKKLIDDMGSILHHFQDIWQSLD